MLQVSVVIPTYNRSHLIQRAIDSALASLTPGDEVIVVDDGSTDDTVAIVSSYGEQVRLIHADHRGAGPARNIGFAAAENELVAFLDSDDEWFPDKVELQRALLEARPELIYAFTDFAVRLEDGTEHRNYLPRWMHPHKPYSAILGPAVNYSSIAPLPAGREDFEVYIGSIYEFEMWSNLVPTFTFIVRKSGVGESLLFSEDLPIGEDWEAFGRLARYGPVALLDTETAWQNGHSGPRITETPTYLVADAWATILERVWGKDKPFLAEHETQYKRAMADANVLKAGSLARHGKLGKAARALRVAGVGGLLAIVTRGGEWIANIFNSTPPPA
jgi:glycosyltransferase involved in cell wall biosynthesis